jgi:hypothetical protein
MASSLHRVRHCAQGLTSSLFTLSCIRFSSTSAFSTRTT